jgi:putative transposase
MNLCGLKGRATRRRIAPQTQSIATIPGERSNMPQSLSRVLIHLVYSTKQRAPLLTDDVREELHAYLSGVLNNHDCVSLQVGGVEDHVHLLFALSRTMTIAENVELLKTSSSKWIKTRGPRWSEFHWQTAYGAFSVGESQVSTVVHYIQNQAEHHREMSFQDEFRRILELYRVSYDERYVWD